MKVALIKNDICENVVMFDTIELAFEFFSSIYDYIIECPESKGIGYRYIEGNWYNPQPNKVDGVYYYTKDMDVELGDIVIETEYTNEEIVEKRYTALESIKLQQLPPSELPDKYSEVV